MSEFNMKAIGICVGKCRDRSKLTQKELAAKCDLTETYISHIENGRANSISINTLLKLSKALGVTPDDLLRDNLVVYQKNKSPSTFKDRFVEELETATYSQLDFMYKTVNRYIDLLDKKSKGQ